jgi:hypothetical protein
VLYRNQEKSQEKHCWIYALCFQSSAARPQVAAKEIVQPLWKPCVSSELTICDCFVKAA